MTDFEAQVGAVVRVKDEHRREYLRGKLGTIRQFFGQPEYLALDVLLEDGRLELFWHYDLEKAQDMSNSPTKKNRKAPD